MSTDRALECVLRKTSLWRISFLCYIGHWFATWIWIGCMESLIYAFDTHPGISEPRAGERARLSVREAGCFCWHGWHTWDTATDRCLLSVETPSEGSRLISQSWRRWLQEISRIFCRCSSLLCSSVTRLIDFAPVRYPSFRRHSSGAA